MTKSVKEIEFIKAFSRFYPHLYPTHHDTGVLEAVKYRWDWVWSIGKDGVLVEIQGGIFMPKSGHNTGKSLIRDYRKNNLAQLSGWTSLLIPATESTKRVWSNMVASAISRKCEQWEVVYDHSPPVLIHEREVPDLVDSGSEIF